MADVRIWCQRFISNEFVMTEPGEFDMTILEAKEAVDAISMDMFMEDGIDEIGVMINGQIVYKKTAIRYLKEEL